jgi:hypothetical protein
MTWRFALLLLIVTRASACSCNGKWPSVKQAWEKAPFVFLGTVEMADPDDVSSQTIFQAQSVRIHVDEVFKGTSRGQTIELHQAGTDCDAKFRTGQRAVFYLYAGRTPGSWSVPWCTHALGNAESGGEDLLFLRGLPKSAIGTRLSGTVELYEDSPTEAFRRVGGVPNIRVKIMGPMGFAQEEMTNAAGVYEVLGLRPGRYSVSIEVPKGLKVKFPLVTGSPRVQGLDAAVELSPNGAVSVGFVLQADTRLSGRMLDAKGAPMSGVCIDLEPMEGRGEDGARFFDCSKTGGVFTMTMMPPGKYWLVAHDDIQLDLLKSKSTFYYPGLREREQATMVSIAAGDYVEHLEMRLPHDEKRYKISGKVQFADGAPAAIATVTFTSPEHGYSETTGTGPDGSFGLPVIAGMKGQLSGHLVVMEPILKVCPEFRVGPRRRGMFRFMDVSPISLSSDSDHGDLKLELPSPSCASWPPGHK